MHLTIKKERKNQHYDMKNEEKIINTLYDFLNSYCKNPIKLKTIDIQIEN